MASKKTSIYRSSEAGQFVIGGKASAKISKVEGMTLSKDMRATLMISTGRACLPMPAARS